MKKNLGIVAIILTVISIFVEWLSRCLCVVPEDATLSVKINHLFNETGLSFAWPIYLIALFFAVVNLVFWSRQNKISKILGVIAVFFLLIKSVGLIIFLFF